MTSSETLIDDVDDNNTKKKTDKNYYFGCFGRTYSVFICTFAVDYVEAVCVTLFIQKCHAHNLIIHIDCLRFSLPDTSSMNSEFGVLAEENHLCLLRSVLLCVMSDSRVQFVRATERMSSVFWGLCGIWRDTRVTRWKTRKCNTNRWRAEEVSDFGRTIAQTTISLASFVFRQRCDSYAYIYELGNVRIHRQHNRFQPLQAASAL